MKNLRKGPKLPEMRFLLKFFLEKFGGFKKNTYFCIAFEK